MNSFLNVEENLRDNWRTRPYHQPCTRSVNAVKPLKKQSSCCRRLANIQRKEKKTFQFLRRRAFFSKTSPSLPAMLKFFANEDRVKRCLLPHDQNKSAASRGSSGARACAVMHIHTSTDKNIYFKNILVWSSMFAPANT